MSKEQYFEGYEKMRIEQETRKSDGKQLQSSDIEKLIIVYEIRIKAVSKLMAETQDVEKLLRGAGEHEAYVGIVIDLKELLPK